MTKLTKQIFIFGMSAFLFMGCSSKNVLSDPNTQTGAGIGAVAGGIIGGNVGDRSGSNIAGGAVLGATIGAAVGNATSDNKPQETGGWE